MKQLLLSLTLLCLSACKKDDPDASLPPATQVGANTGGCLINGERFIATGWGGNLLSNPIPPLFGGFAFDSVYYLQLNGLLRGQNTTVTLFLRSDRVGTYSLNKKTQYYPQGSPRYVLNHATYSLSDGMGDVYVTDMQHTGSIVLTRSDVGSGIGAGTFEFTAASQVDPTKTVTITSGRFDRKQ